MKRALADVLFFLGAAAVVLFAFALFIVVFQVQNIIGLDRAFVRAGSFVVEFVRLDQQAVTWFGLFAGLVIVIMARLSCQLPRSQVESTPHPGRRRRPGSLDLKLPQPGRSSQTLQC